MTRERALGLAVAVLAAAATVLSTVAIDGGPLESARTARILLPADGPVVKDGDDVRVSGIRVGQVRKVALTPHGAEATLTVGDAGLRADASARVQLRGLAGAVDVDLDPGRAAENLPDGASLGRATAGTLVSDVVAGFDADTRRALGRTLSAFGTGLAGRGEALNRMLGDLEPALAGMTPVLRALRPAPGAFGDLVAQADRVAAAMPAGELEGLIRAAAPVAATFGERSDAIAAAIGGAPALEEQVARTAPAADALLDRLRPTLAALEPGIRSLDALLGDLRAVERQGPELDRLTDIARAAAPVLRRAAPVAESLYPSAASLGALVAPVDTLARYLLPYGDELVEAPAGFTRWGDFAYQEGQAPGARAVRFSMIFTCAKARDPYPRPGVARRERKRCLG